MHYFLSFPRVLLFPFLILARVPLQREIKERKKKSAQRKDRKKEKELQKDIRALRLGFKNLLSLASPNHLERKNYNSHILFYSFFSYSRAPFLYFFFFFLMRELFSSALRKEKRNEIEIKEPGMRKRM